MFISPLFRPALFGDDLILRSVDHLEDYWPKGGVRNNKDTYEIFINAQDYGPKNVSVKTSEGSVIVEGKHDEKKDEYGYVSRQFTRRFPLPEDCDLDKLESRMSPEGLLIIKAPRKEVVKRDTVIPVTHDRAKSKL